MSTDRDANANGWFAARDHRRIGLLFLGWSLGALLIGAIFSLLVTIRSLGAETMAAQLVFRAQTYQHLILVFLFLVPAVPSILGYLRLPPELGLDDMVLPGLSRAGLQLYAAGLLLTLLSYLLGPVSADWTLATPQSLQGDGAFGVLAAGLALAALGWFLTGVNFIVTVHRGGATRDGLLRMPVFAWSLYLAGYQLVLSGVLFAVLIGYLGAARHGGQGLFAADADPLLWQGYFWFVTTQAVFFSLVPAAGVVGAITAALSRKPPAYPLAVNGSLLALAVLGALAWGSRLGVYGQPPALTFAFSAIALLAVLPAAVLAWCWLATLYRGAVATGGATVFAVGFFVHAGVAAGMGLLLASPAAGAYLGATAFATAQLDYLIWGAALCALLAGLHHWWPDVTGRAGREDRARFWGIAYLVGVNLALAPRVLLGTQGVPGDYFAFAGLGGPAVWISAAGWLLLFVSLRGVLWNLVSAAWRHEA